MADNTYDDFSQDYDYFVNWRNRLNAEIPFIETRLKDFDFTNTGKTSILDAACGTGMHAIELARHGFVTAGADLSIKMVEKARLNGAKSGFNVPFKEAGFSHLQEAFSGEQGYPFDSIICLGNALPHLTSEDEIRNALKDFAACLKPGGVLILQNRNFDAVLSKRERWIAPQSHREGSREWLFLRFYDFDQDGLITFNIVRLSRESDSQWTQKISAVRLFPLLKEKLADLLLEAGFTEMHFYGVMDEVAFKPTVSENLVAVSRKA